MATGRLHMAIDFVSPVNNASNVARLATFDPYNEYENAFSVSSEQPNSLKLD